MRFILLTVLTALLVVFLNPVAPYWVVMIGILILSALLNPTSLGGFMGGGLGMGLTWLGQSIYLGIVNDSALPDKIGELMGLGSGMTLIAITGILGFAFGSFSALTGVLFRRILQKTPADVYKG
jgi:hypothetical protein